MALLVFVIVVAGALVAADLVARSVAEHAIATDVRRSTGSDASTATISSFPFLYDAAVEGRLDRVTVVDRGVPVGPARLDEVSVVASQVHFDRHLLLSQHAVRLTSVGSATVTVDVHLASLTGRLARDLGVRVTASASDRITVSAAGVPITTVDLTKVAIIPECPLQVDHSGDTYTFSCTVSPVPASVLAALSRAEHA